MFSKPRINIYLSKYNNQHGTFINNPYFLSIKHYIPPEYLRNKTDVQCAKLIIQTLDHRNGIKLSNDDEVIQANSYYEHYFK